MVVGSITGLVNQRWPQGKLHADRQAPRVNIIQNTEKHVSGDTGNPSNIERRRTPVPSDVPVAFPAQFSKDQAKQVQWRAFISQSRLDTSGIGLQRSCSFCTTS